MTATTPTTTTFPGTGNPTNRRRWIALSAGALALAGAVGVVTFDGSGTDAPAIESVVPVNAAAVRGPVSADAAAVRGPVSADAAERHAVSAAAVVASAPAGPVSADAAERHAVDAATSSCAGLPADAAERCVTAGR